MENLYLKYENDKQSYFEPKYGMVKINSNKNKNANLGLIGANIVNSAKNPKNFKISQRNYNIFEPNFNNNEFSIRSNFNYLQNTPKRKSKEKEVYSPNFNSPVIRQKIEVKNHNSSSRPRKKPDNIGSYSPNININNNIYFPIEVLINMDNLINEGFNQNFGGLNKNASPKHISFLTINEDSLYSYVSFLSIWIDIFLNLDNKVFLSNYSSRFIEEFDKFFLVHKNNLDIFDSDLLNKLFQKFFKYSSILFFLLKMIITEFYFDYNTKMQIKKLFNFLNEIVCIFFDVFVFSNVSKAFRYNKKELIDKVIKISKSSSGIQGKRNKTTELMFHLSKMYDNLGNLVKNFSNSHFKQLVNPVYQVTLGLVNNMEELPNDQFISLLYRNVLFGILKKEERGFQRIHKDDKLKVSDNPPYLPPISSEFKYTLVLDLDETLIHFFYTPNGGTFFVRPFALEFLEDLNKMYEIVVFTAATKEYADNILNLLDQNNNLIKYRIYRHHTTVLNDDTIKDLNNLGRDIKKLIIIDNIADNYKNQPNNGFLSKTWKDDILDSQLFDFKNILIEIFRNKVDDVRNVVGLINAQINNNKEGKIDFSRIFLKLNK